VWGTDLDYRHSAGEGIVACCEVVYEDDLEVRDLEEVFEHLSRRS
jgi:hypothetical protein